VSWQASTCVGTVAVNFADLKKTLIDELGPKHVQFGVKLKYFLEEDEGVRLFLSDDNNESEMNVMTKLLIGCDGAHSVVREGLLPGDPFHYLGFASIYGFHRTLTTSNNNNNNININQIKNINQMKNINDVIDDGETLAFLGKGNSLFIQPPQTGGFRRWNYTFRCPANEFQSLLNQSQSTTATATTTTTTSTTENLKTMNQDTPTLLGDSDGDALREVVLQGISEWEEELKKKLVVELFSSTTDMNDKNNNIHIVPLIDRPPLPHWSSQRVALAGDAFQLLARGFSDSASVAITHGFQLSEKLERQCNLLMEGNDSDSFALKRFREELSDGKKNLYLARSLVGLLNKSRFYRTRNFLMTHCWTGRSDDLT